MSMNTAAQSFGNSIKIAGLQAALMGLRGFGRLLPKSLHALRIRQQGAPSYWSGVVRKSVAMQNHAGACNAKRPHQGGKECERRKRQMARGII